MAKFEEEDFIRDSEGFVFQTPVRAKKSRPATKPNVMQMTAALGRIGRIARRRPEVMIKVTGSAHGFRSLKEHLAYITRNGKLIGEREDGTLIEGVANVRSLAEEWWDKSGVDRPARARDTINLILSMPAGTDPRAVAEAARAFAKNLFGSKTCKPGARHSHSNYASAASSRKPRHGGYAALPAKVSGKPSDTWTSARRPA